MPVKNNRSAGTLLQNSQEAVIITTNICFLTNFTELELTNVQANYWGGGDCIVDPQPKLWRGHGLRAPLPAAPPMVNCANCGRNSAYSLLLAQEEMGQAWY